jgi:hypothetical protein
VALLPDLVIRPRSKSNLACRRASAFRNLLDGEAASLEEAQQQADTKMGAEAWGTVVRRFISSLELR